MTIKQKALEMIRRYPGRFKTALHLAQVLEVKPQYLKLYELERDNLIYWKHGWRAVS